MEAERAAPLNDIDLNDPVTRHMRTDFAQLHSGQTVGEALAAIRAHPTEGRIIYFYVVDDDSRLKGVVPTRRLLLNPLDSPIADIMVKDVITIPEMATVLDACEFFVLHKLLAFPVVDSERRLRGLVDVDLYTQEMSDLDRREGNDDLFQLIGVHLTMAQQASVSMSFRQRFPWLLCNIGGGILAAFLSGLFEAELQRVVALALFIPVVLALAESVGIQSVSLALQTLHGQRPSWGSLVPKLRRELLTGLALGTASGLSVGVVALLWLGQWRLAACLVGGISAGMACAAALGLAVPTVLRLLRLDPRVAAGPVALAAADTVTLLAYFTLARLLLA